MKKVSEKKPAVRKAPSMTVSEANLRRTAMRVLGQSLVSSEVHYIQRTLGASTTQEKMDDSVMAVRKLPWSSIVLPD